MEDKNYLQEAFKEFDMLKEEVFDISIDNELQKAKEFNDEVVDDTEEVVVIDDTIEDIEDVADSYVGKAILQCPTCQSMVYKTPEEVVIDEEQELANIGEMCPYCQAEEGFKVIGEVTEFEDEDVECKDGECEIKADETEEDTEEINDKSLLNDVKEESLRTSMKSKVIKESIKKRLKEKRLVETGEWEDDEEGVAWKKGLADLVKKYTRGMKKFAFTKDDIKGFDKYQGPYINTEIGTIWSDGVRDDSFIVEYGNTYYRISSREDAKDLVKGELRPLDESIKTRKSVRSKENKRNLKEEVSSEAYKVADYINNLSKDKTFISRETFNGFFIDAVRNIGVDRKIYQDNDFETDVRGILGNMGWETIFEGEDEGSLRLVESSTRDDIDAKADDKKEKAKKKFMKAKDDADADRDYRLKRNKLKEAVKRFRTKKSVKEDFNKVDIETDREKMSMVADENGKVTVTTEPIKNVREEGEQEMIAPVSDKIKAKFKVADKEDEDKEYTDVDFDEIDETEFDNLGESYLKRVYENVESFKTTRGVVKGNQLKLEGIIKFKSGKEAKTNFIFESVSVSKKGKLTFFGENQQITKGKKSFTLIGTTKNNKLFCECLRYDYQTRGNDGKSTRVSGSVLKK